jgi:uncharacterized protein (UPF0332 family)
MFNAARAMLVSRGRGLPQMKTHRSVLSQFALEFVRPGLMTAEDGRAIRRAADARHLADYDGEISRAEAEENRGRVDRFMVAAEALLSTPGDPP